MEKLLLGLTLIFIVIYLWYGSLVKKRNIVHEALTGIDLQLTKRTDLVPYIVNIAEQFMAQEKLLLTSIIEISTQLIRHYNKADPNAVEQHLAQAEQLNSKMGDLIVKMDNYPELKSDNTLLQEIQTYNEIHVHISTASRFYNSAVLELNTAVEIFPGSIIASLAGIKVMPFYEVIEVEKPPVDVAEYL